MIAYWVYPRRLKGLRIGMSSRATDLVQAHILTVQLGLRHFYLFCVPGDAAASWRFWFWLGIVARGYAHRLAQSSRRPSVAASGVTASSQRRHETVRLRADSRVRDRPRLAGRRPVVEAGRDHADQTRRVRRARQRLPAILRHQHRLLTCRSVAFIMKRYVRTRGRTHAVLLLTLTLTVTLVTENKINVNKINLLTLYIKFCMI